MFLQERHEFVHRLVRVWIVILIQAGYDYDIDIRSKFAARPHSSRAAIASLQECAYEDGLQTLIGVKALTQSLVPRLAVIFLVLRRPDLAKEFPEGFW